MSKPVEINPNGQTDNYGRIIDPHTGRPLRDRRSRTFGSQPFQGRDGKPNRKAQKRLAKRLKAFEDSKAAKKHQQHKPGSLK